jgi:hypothetical protein
MAFWVVSEEEEQWIYEGREGGRMMVGSVGCGLADV